MYCPIMSVIFGKELYLIPQKMLSKRYWKFRGYHPYIRFSDYQTARIHIPQPPSLEKRKGS